jgi:putative flippase GtrA
MLELNCVIQIFIEFFRYGITGILSLLVYLALSNLLFYFGLPVCLATVIAWGLAAATSYFGHVSFSYKVAADHRLMPVRFAVMLCGNFCLTFLITYICLNAFELPYLLTTVVTVSITSLATFPAGKFWVFKEQTELAKDLAE